MIAFLTGLLKRVNWSAILGAAIGIAGVIFGAFKNEQAKATKAEAERKVEQKEAEVAQGNAKAQEKATNAVVAAKKAKEEVAKIPDDELDQAGRELGILRD